jgi:hypothetical protein
VGDQSIRRRRRTNSFLEDCHNLEKARPPN